MKKKKKQKINWNKIAERMLFWTPRIILIGFIVFLSLFSLDVWSEQGSFFLKLAGFFIHLIPSLILVAFLYIAWKWEILGAILLACIGLIMTVFFDTYETLIAFLALSVPVFIVSGLFYWHYRFVHSKTNSKKTAVKKKSAKRKKK